MCAPINLPSINGWCKNGINFRQFLGKYVRHQRHKLSLNLISLKKRVWLNDHIFSFFVQCGTMAVFSRTHHFSPLVHIVYLNINTFIYCLLLKSTERQRDLCVRLFIWMCLSACACVWAMWTVCFWLLRLMFYVYVLHTICHTNQQNNCGNKMTEER